MAKRRVPMNEESCRSKVRSRRLTAWEFGRQHETRSVLRGRKKAKESSENHGKTQKGSRPPPIGRTDLGKQQEQRRGELSRGQASAENRTVMRIGVQDELEKKEGVRPADETGKFCVGGNDGV